MRQTTVTVLGSGKRQVEIKTVSTETTVGEFSSVYLSEYISAYTLKRVIPQHDAEVESGERLTVVTKTPNRVTLVSSGMTAAEVL